MNDASHIKTVAGFLRTHDRDHYLASLFAPQPVRDDLMALNAFAAEIARVPDLVSEPMLGEIRLQWWRDALDTLDRGGTTGNPIADGLGAAMRSHTLSRALLLGAIDARTFDLSGEPMPDMQALKAYLQKTEGVMFELAAIIVCGEKPDRDTRRVAQSAGLAWGLTKKLRLLSRDLSRGRLYLPLQEFEAKGVSPSALFEGKGSDQTSAVLRDLRTEAREALAATQAGLRDKNGNLVLAVLPCALVPPYLKALAHKSPEALKAVADINPLRRIIRIARAAITGRLG